MVVINKHILGPLGIGGGEFLLNTNPWVFVILANGFIGASLGMIIFSSAIEAIPKDYRKEGVSLRNSDTACLSECDSINSNLFCITLDNEDPYYWTKPPSHRRFWF